MNSIEKLHAALNKMHKRACGDMSQVYMSIPARHDRDADLLLSAALEELEQLREFKRMALELVAGESEYQTAWPDEWKREYSKIDPQIIARAAARRMKHAILEKLSALARDAPLTSAGESKESGSDLNKAGGEG